MAAFQSNLFVRLHKWALRQDENFLTEAFAYVLEHLVKYEPQAAASILSHITNGLISSPADMPKVVIRTQVRGEQGIPDIELRTDKHFVIIEAKGDAPAYEDQLRRYRTKLDDAKSTTPETIVGLFMLTRYPVSIPGADGYFRWYEVAEWIEQSRNYSFKANSQFLVDEFLGFLKVRNMTMGQITWELPMGVRSLRTLADMFYEAAIACGVKAQISGTAEWMGIKVDGNKYWAGIEYSDPERIVFGTNMACIDPQRADGLCVGSTYEWSNKKGHGWRRELVLESEETHFFSRSKASQLQFLEKFLRENYAFAKNMTIETTNQPAEAI
jgi:hypothetical protein